MNPSNKLGWKPIKTTLLTWVQPNCTNLNLTCVKLFFFALSTSYSHPKQKKVTQNVI